MVSLLRKPAQAAPATLTDIDAKIDGLHAESASLTARQADINTAVAANEGLPTDEHATEYARITLRLNAIPGVLEKLHTQRAQLEIGELRQRLDTTEGALQAVTADEQAWEQERYDRRIRLDLYKQMSVEILRSKHQKADAIITPRLAIFARLLELGDISDAEFEHERDRMRRLKSPAPDNSVDYRRRVLEEVDKEIYANHGIHIPDRIRGYYQAAHLELDGE